MYAVFGCEIWALMFLGVGSGVWPWLLVGIVIVVGSGVEIEMLVGFVVVVHSQIEDGMLVRVHSVV